ncbi:YdcF family protein [Orrella marina]|uniref:DUF218 domain-containing protein n=1 Tax=Orrella marina TaxID=2163011 RepID=A0A2R4XI30_9BURK|nr:YdcF family protein [Orrella marina]AWB33461.1 hypothetical protein DBV39_06785 [Orrella marina]
MSFDLNSLIKFLTWLASPMGAFTACALLSFVLLVFHQARKFRTWVILLACLQLIFFALPGVAAWLHRGLEHQAHQIVAQRSVQQPFAGILLLGGAGQSFPSSIASTFGHADFGDAVDRILYAAQLYREGVAPRIIITGGNWRLEDTDRPSEASSTRELLIHLGVPAEDILVEERSRTTRENFLYTDALLKQHGINGPLALVTSASHMPRAIRNAQTLRIDAEGFPTDWRSHGLMLHALPWLPSASALSQSEVALKEWLAYLIDY